MIDHQRTGYLAQPYEVEDLEKVMLWAAYKNKNRNERSRYCRQKVEKNFSEIISARRYTALYDELNSTENGVRNMDSGKSV